MARASTDKITRHYNTLAHFYDHAWHIYLKRTLARTMELMELTGSEHILDVASGTGELERHITAVHPAQSIVGIDLTEGMIAKAQKKLAHAPHVKFLKADSRNLPFDDAEFDIVVSCSALHYMREPQQVIHEMARVVRPGGQVIILDWCREFFRAKLYNWWRKIFIPAHHHIYTIAEIQAFLESAHLTPTHAETLSIQWLWQIMAVTARK